MKKTIISIIGIAVMLLAITACRPNYVIVPIPGGGTSSTPSGTPVSDASELQNALANGEDVYLEKDITLPEDFVMPGNSIIDGNGNTLTVPTGTNPGTGILDLAKSGVTLKNVTLNFTQGAGRASLFAAPRAAGDMFAVLIGSGDGNMETAPSGITLSNVTIKTGGAIAGINVHTAKNVTLEDITIDNCKKAPISISSSTVIIGGELKASGSSWYGKDNVIQINGVGGDPNHQPSTVTFKSTEGIDAVWREAVAADYEKASDITDANFQKAGQTVINGLDRWEVRYSDQPSKKTKGWMFYSPSQSQNATTFTLNADSKVAEKAEEDIRAMLTAIAESDPARKYSVIKLGQDIKLDAQLDIGIPVTIDGSDSKYTISLETVPSGAEDSEKSALFIKSSDVHLKNLTVSGPNTAPSGWDEGEYAIKAYGSYDGIPHQITNVTLENVKITKANAGMLVRGAAVTLNGTIDLENLEWGGIGVDSQGNEGGTPVTFDCDLSIASGCKISYTGTGSNAKPAIWTEHKDNSNETVIGAESIGLKEMAGPGDKSAQTWYVTDSYITQ